MSNERPNGLAALSRVLPLVAVVAAGVAAHYSTRGALEGALGQQALRLRQLREALKRMDGSVERLRESLHDHRHRFGDRGSHPDALWRAFDNLEQRVKELER